MRQSEVSGNQDLVICMSTTDVERKKGHIKRNVVGYMHTKLDQGMLCIVLFIVQINEYEHQKYSTLFF